jgi:hypothetical protein
MAGRKTRSPDYGRFYLACCVLVVLSIVTARHVFADQTRRALIVSPFDGSVVVFNRLEASIRREMQSQFSSGIETYTEFLDIGQFPGPEHAARIASFLHDKYARRHIDVVIAIAPEALNFLLQRRDCPIEPRRRQELYLITNDSRVNSIAIVLDFVAPGVPFRRLFERQGQLRLRLVMLFFASTLLAPHEQKLWCLKLLALRSATASAARRRYFTYGMPRPSFSGLCRIADL